MKKKATNGLGMKLVLAVIFLAGLFMFCNIFMCFEETEEIEGVVEHTYVSRSYNGVTKHSSEGVPMCRVVWYDKEGEKVTYGMPDDKGYEVGDSYFLEVDIETNRIPKRSVGEGVVAAIIGFLTCASCVVIWKVKFGAKKQRENHQQKDLSPIEKKRREVYNPQDYQAVIKCSICNGEQVAGFKDRKTGHFTEIMLIRNDQDLKNFKQRYGLEEVKKEY